MTYATVTTYEIGTTYAGRVNVETLTTKKANMAPRAQYFPYAETVPTGDGGQTTRGFPFALWSYDGFVYADLFNALRAICPGASADVIIRTIKEDYTTFGYFSAKMLWPDPQSYEQVTTSKGLGYRNLQFKFANLVVYTP